mmetsp:Transcript_7502/g.13486  ORF Transcript_7502/g.13486 Transcript_7502/m.13486 type:complete len:993 (-) Transcript_7502:135-3113(-)
MMNNNDGGNNMMNNNNNHGMPPPNYHPMHHDHHHHPGIPPQYGHGMGGMPDGMIPPHYPNNNMGHNNNNNMFPPHPAPPRWNNSNNGMEQQQRHSRGGWDNHNHNYNHRDSGEHGRENSSMYRGGDRGGNRDEFGRGAGQRDGRHHDEHNRHSSNQHIQDSQSRRQDNKMAATMMKKRLREDMMAAAVPSPDDVGIVVPAAEAESTSTDDPSTWSQSKKRRMRTRRKKEAAKEQLVAGEGGDANRNGSADSTKSDDSVGDQSASSKNATLRNSDNSHECTTAEEKANSASDTNPESDRIQRRKEKKQRKKELRKQTKEVSIQNPSVKVTPTITDSSSPPQTNTETSSVEAVGGQHGSAGGMTVAVPPGLGMASSGVPRPELSTSQPPPQQQQAPQQEMFTNFQQAQQMQGDPNQHQQAQQQQQQQQYQQQEQQHYQQQQQVQFDQQNIGQMQQQPMYDQYGNQVYDPNYQQQQYQQQQQQDATTNQQQQQQPSLMGNLNNTQNQFPISNSIGSLAPMNPTSSLASMTSFGKMIKTDSHAVLMELFARDQDLVRQAAGKGSGNGGGTGMPQVQQAAVAAAAANITNNGATRSLQSSGLSGNLRWANGITAIANSAGSPSNNMGQKQHSVTFEGVPSLSSWPHFSSVSSLNNLGGLQGVKSITNLSMADLSSQGNLNKMGNLAQVKSVENMGRGDSFAFLEVFFDDKSGLSSSNHSNGQRGVKRERDYDDAIGLSLDGDDGASPGQQFSSNNNNNKHSPSNAEQAPAHATSAMEAGAPSPAPLPEDGLDHVDVGDDNESSSEGGKLKRAYDDALAARGLIAVRRSCENLTDLSLPSKMQRTLSLEYIRQHTQGQPMGDFFSTNNSAYAPNNHQNNNGSSQQLYSMQQTASEATLSDPNIANASVEVPSSTKCALCTSTNVDTQLRPCGHMFHGRCLKPSLQNAAGPPKCPLCHTPMQSAILAVPSAAGTEGTGAAGMTSGTSTTDSLTGMLGGA